MNSAAGLAFPFVSRKPILARFDGGDITSDAGVLLLAQADRKIGLCQRLSGSIMDRRDARKISHSVLDLLRERVYAIGMGYEDANDLDTLADDPALRLACGRRLTQEDRLASQPTLSRLENDVDSKDLLSMAWELGKVVVEQLPIRSRHVILDVDASEDPCHGQQELELFNLYYDSHCYLPLFLHVTAEDQRQRLLAALLRPGRADVKDGLFALLSRALELLWDRFPQLSILLRADGGFGQAEVIRFCRKRGLPFVLGLPTNSRIKTLVAPFEEDALKQAGVREEPARYYATFLYRADTWDQPERVIARMQIVAGKVDTRFVVTSLHAPAQEVYALYCGRGEQENRIKECKLDLGSGRTSCHRFLANQFRLLLHAAACVLFCVLQDHLTGTKLEKAQIGTLRLKLLKVGAQAKETSRLLWLRLSSSFTQQRLWYTLYVRLAAT